MRPDAARRRKTYKVANIQRLRNPLVRNPTKRSREPVDVLSSIAAVSVDVASQTSAMLWVTDQENALDSIERRSGKLRQRIRRRGRSLRVALKKEALARVRLQSGLDFAHDVVCSDRGDLGEVGWIDGVVDFAAGELGLNVGVHGAEARRGSLQFAGTAGVDYGVAGAGILSGKDGGVGG